MEIQEDAEHQESGVSERSVEIAVSLLFLVLGGVFMWDTWRLGAGWSDSGPQSGYFPFYVSLIMSLSSLVILVQAIRAKPGKSAVFVTHGQLLLVLKVLTPAAVFVAAIYFLGIYVASAIYIAGFMMWVGKYGILRSALVGVTVAVLSFFTFEVWFLVPLPKGPLETLLGY